MDFSASFRDSEKRKMSIVVLIFTLIFILSIMGAVWIQISTESEGRFLIWFVICGKVFLSRNLWEYPGMMDLVAIFVDNKRIVEFQDEDTEKHFWSIQ